MTNETALIEAERMEAGPYPELANLTEHRELIQKTPTEVINEAKSVADAVVHILEQTHIVIQGKKYIKIEGWQGITSCFNCALSSYVESVDEEGNVTARADVVDLNTGAIRGSAVGYVGMDESRWSKAERYAVIGMAQTRAMSRAARNCFMLVPSLTGYASTPAEEMEQASDRKPSGTPQKKTRKRRSLIEMIKDEIGFDEGTLATLLGVPRDDWGDKERRLLNGAFAQAKVGDGPEKKKSVFRAWIQEEQAKEQGTKSEGTLPF